MAVLGTALVALMWSGVIVAGAAVGNLVAGNQLGVTGANLAVLIGVLWATSFLALVVMDATRQALHRRKTLRPENEPQRGSGDLRFTIAVAALSLAMGSITWRYLGGEFTVGQFIYAIIYNGGVAVIAVIVVEAFLKRRGKSPGPGS